MAHKAQKSHTTKDILLFHWKQAMRFRRLAWTSFIIGPASIILERYVAPLIIAAVLFDLQQGDIKLADSWWMIAVYAALQVGTQIIGYRINLYAMWGVQVQGMQAIYQNTYAQLTTQSLDFYSNNFAGSLVSRVNKFAAAYAGFWDVVIFRVMFTVVSVLASIIGIAFLVWQYAIVLTIFVAAFIVAAYFGTRFMRPRQKARSKAYTKISAQLSDSIANMFSVKIDSREAYERTRLNGAIDTMVEKEYQVRSGIVRISTVYATITTLIRLSVLILSIWAVEHGVANAASIYLVLTYTFNLLEELKNVVAMFRSIYQITGDSEEMLDTLAEPISVKDTGTNTLQVTKGTIALHDVSFRHAESRSDLFDALNLTIPAGQKVGIVGVSGSGKTTLTKLILRFIDPTAGTLTIDETDIAKVTQESLHNNIAYVPQEPLLFHRSILENIRYSRPDADEALAHEAAKKAHVHSFIDDLPDGFDTLVGERGVKLSGGQRQRIAIARAILKDAPILILDEATSALDSESEAYIQEALDTLMQGRTSIVIAHRLSTITKLDRIIVLENGRIIEDGSHAELLKK